MNTKPPPPPYLAARPPRISFDGNAWLPGQITWTARGAAVDRLREKNCG